MLAVQLADMTVGGVSGDACRSRPCKCVSGRIPCRRMALPVSPASVAPSTLAGGADAAAEGPPTAAVCLFRSLADPTRLAILRHLALGEHRVVDLTAHLGLAQSTVSQHLACLRDCGLVTSRPRGRSSLFSLTAEPELREMLAAAERLLAATRDAVTHCPAVQGGR